MDWRGHLAEPKNPKCTEKCSTTCLLPNTLALILYLSPSQAISATSFTQLLRWRANWPCLATRRQRCRSVLVFRQRMRQRGLWQSPLNSVGLVIKWLDEWAISACQPPGPARGAGKLPCWKNCSVQTQTCTHVWLLSEKKGALEAIRVPRWMENIYRLQKMNNLNLDSDRVL